MQEVEKYKGKLMIIQVQIQSLVKIEFINRKEGIKNGMDIKSIQVYFQPLDLVYETLSAKENAKNLAKLSLEAHSEPSHKSKMELFLKAANG